jgi:hypothetical protein
MSTWTLKADRESLGSLLVTHVDRPWVFADFYPSCAFGPWRSVFDERLRSLDEVNTPAVARGGFASSAALNTITLISETGSVVEYEDLFIRADRAWWRLR